ncbi:hypothetical protein HNY73_000727 [Argiope bruennichi]|uniref:Uncharacterized protein n=1 Tax=Argiope bruennichi TaxID=94029 RepID=A0A8T0G527_ARGBR|nr:hypothetical protein HNY73_000727 [Argiope bruennichi]
MSAFYTVAAQELSVSVISLWQSCQNERYARASMDSILGLDYEYSHKTLTVQQRRGLEASVQERIQLKKWGQNRPCPEYYDGIGTPRSAAAIHVMTDKADDMIISSWANIDDARGIYAHIDSSRKMKE